MFASLAIQILLPMVVPTLMAYVWKYWKKTGIDIDQSRIDQINKMAEARAGEFIAMLLSGKLGWGDLTSFALRTAKEAIAGNPDVTKATKLTPETMAKRIEGSIGKLASADPTIALPVPPAGSTIGNVAVAGVKADREVKEVADAPTEKLLPFGGNNIRDDKR